ncbi:glycosyltransferase [Vibrio vulnificus]|uniref:glycosyltransferase n=1 Tax=Vibrio vulnificus TaxID=672 RepID=UPI00165E300A|nr:glycosyltransferase [Vibrio vulnificus]EGR9009285.1 glycosyltransferase [Vibrio vulnificus]EHU9457421.1 glycosyltransferase [Vibrio vulnificus]HAS6191809.1 glycosyltransferase [Vibrio vulnificus]HAS8258983.1 glycosyltransferase [Vibrio vulnificus]
MLTIFVPSYNHEKYIVQTLDKIKCINIPNKKIFVVDDFSSDNSVEMINSYIEENDNQGEFDFICKDKNKGVVDSLNLFLECCTTEYVYLMSSDDIVIPQGVEKIFEIAFRNPELKYVIGGVNNLMLNGTETPVYKDDHRIFFDLNESDRFEELYLNAPSPILSQGTIIRKDALVAIGGWDEDIIADDYSMFLRLLALYPNNGRDFLFVPDVICVKYRHHGENSYTKTQRQYLMTTQVLRKYAPSNLMKEAIARKFGYYLAVSIKNSNFSAVKGIIGASSFKEIGLGLYYFFYFLYKSLRNRCIR